MLHKLKKKDFAVLRGPLESGRQSPDSLPFVLILGIALQLLLHYLTYYEAAATTIFPFIEGMKELHFWITASIIILSIIYSIPVIYKRSQKIQYLVGILCSQNIGTAYVYVIVMFSLGDQKGASVESLITLSKTVLFIAALLFLATCVRFYILLMKGQYRNGSKKGQMRNSFETTSYIPLAIIGSTGLFFILQYVIRMFGSVDGYDMFIIVIAMSVFYSMIFVLPEQLMILYCKFRFKSFNFDKNGVLYKK